MREDKTAVREPPARDFQPSLEVGEPPSQTWRERVTDWRYMIAAAFLTLLLVVVGLGVTLAVNLINQRNDAKKAAATFQEQVSQLQGQLESINSGTLCRASSNANVLVALTNTNSAFLVTLVQLSQPGAAKLGPDQVAGLLQQAQLAQQAATDYRLAISACESLTPGKLKG
jgi:flagellar biosynthesis/type III secretory pathway M-ring protein FliF/YscJ